MSRTSTVTRVVRDHDEAIAWFTEILGFVLLEDTRRSETKRWCGWRRPREGPPSSSRG